MINSLFKDSHITQPFRHSNFSNPERSRQRSMLTNEAREYSTATVKNNQGIIAKNPAEISFSGIPVGRLANESVLKNLYTKTREFLGTEAKHKNIVKLVIDAFDFVSGNTKDTNEQLTKYLNLNEEHVKNVIKKTEEIVKEENINDPLPIEKFGKEVKKIFTSATEAYPAVEKGSKALKNQWLEDFLFKADKNNVTFSAGFAILLTCLLRPASIMTLPGKKNKDDKKYASAHSIASGVIGYCIATAVSNPVTAALDKVLKKPADYITNKSIVDGLKKGSKDPAKAWITRSVDIAMAVPKAVITIALIPPILKYVFGWEKKKKNDSLDSLEHNYALLNFKSTSLPQSKAFQNFTGGNR